MREIGRLVFEWDSGPFELAVRLGLGEHEKLHGQYIPETRTIDLYSIDENVVMHECVHATIDYFRSVENVSMCELFASDSTYGEEAFTYALCEILDCVSQIVVREIVREVLR